jgi:hypothetical protein
VVGVPEDEKRDLEPWEDEEEDDEEALDAAYAGLQRFMHEVDGLLAGESGSVRYRELLTEGELWQFVDLQGKHEPTPEEVDRLVSLYQLMRDRYPGGTGLGKDQDPNPLSGGEDLDGLYLGEGE